MDAFNDPLFEWEFKQDYTASLATAAGVEQSDVTIDGITEGSVAVTSTVTYTVALTSDSDDLNVTMLAQNFTFLMEDNPDDIFDDDPVFKSYDVASVYTMSSPDTTCVALGVSLPLNFSLKTGPKEAFERLQRGDLDRFVGEAKFFDKQTGISVFQQVLSDPALLSQTAGWVAHAGTNPELYTMEGMQNLNFPKSLPVEGLAKLHIYTMTSMNQIYSTTDRAYSLDEVKGLLKNQVAGNSRQTTTDGSEITDVDEFDLPNGNSTILLPSANATIGQLNATFGNVTTNLTSSNSIFDTDWVTYLAQLAAGVEKAGPTNESLAIQALRNLRIEVTATWRYHSEVAPLIWHLEIDQLNQETDQLCGFNVGSYDMEVVIYTGEGRLLHSATGELNVYNASETPPLPFGVAAWPSPPNPPTPPTPPLTPPQDPEEAVLDYEVLPIEEIPDDDTAADDDGQTEFAFALAIGCTAAGLVLVVVVYFVLRRQIGRALGGNPAQLLPYTHSDYDEVMPSNGILDHNQGADFLATRPSSTREHKDMSLDDNSVFNQPTSVRKAGRASSAMGAQINTMLRRP
ncbi:hypothetical protein CYMTET_32703 [Cymbomonas tetramitiformis]|uniref:Uncharacterized protein n=1 Tax=Cymbomonas tetramitiformis TaxID=36881 RepID=A0AAE0KRL1_9CHLO|nr:hypothetical protein CYMTET_32703 [Cymbomonas tetramitiformis]